MKGAGFNVVRMGDLSQQEKRIPITGERKGIISNRVYQGAVILGPQEADLIP
jgi:hypothetical protein